MTYICNKFRANTLNMSNFEDTEKYGFNFLVTVNRLDYFSCTTTKKEVKFRVFSIVCK